MRVGGATDIPSWDKTVAVTNPSGAGKFVLVCEHASNVIPVAFDNLGLSRDLLQSHIAWDPGALPVAQVMSVKLDAPLVWQRVSRLIYDCNRPLEAESAIASISENHEIPGNRNLSTAERQARAEQYYAPFHGALVKCIDQQVAARRQPVVITVHSFAPVFGQEKRDLDIGILHDTDSRFADALIDVSQAKSDYVIRRNEPYGPQDGVMHTLATHALPRGLLNVMLEIRHDLIENPGNQRAMGEWLSDRAAEAMASMPKMVDNPECVLPTG